jgi:GH35 family endo-1,4-beta-xylanase
MIPTLVLQHIDEITRATAPYVDEWDVVNEPYDNHDLMDLSGWGAMIDWFVRAQANLPEAPRYLNDHGILSSHGVDLAHQANAHEILGWLVAEGAPISGFGMQSHMGASPTSIPRVLEVLDSFAAHGLSIRITEFDLNSDDERLQADYTRDFLTAVFSHPAVAGFQMWGFWEGAHWLPRGAMYRRDWSEKPNGTAYRDLVFNEWQTRGSGRTDRDGRFTARGFYGDYRVVVRRGSRSVEATLRLERGASGAVTVTLPGG